MLNCTDLACVLHHHHFYAHLHQLKHHLQDDADNTGLTNGGGSENDDFLTIANETDAPNDIIYMVCGVVIAMLLVGVIIILVAVTINKLRKRDESSGPQSVSVQTTTQPATSINVHSRSSNGSLCDYQQSNHQVGSTDKGGETLADCSHMERQIQEVTFIRTSGGLSSMQGNNWVFPPKAPTPHLYSCMNDALMSTNEKNGFKGFRKQFSGRFKRLVSKKPEPVPAIPPELKPQLKTIYVY